MNKKILYISYDGMTDPLGQSQVLPYLTGLSRYGYEFTILSFEKKDRYKANRHTIENITGAAGIRWVPLSFTGKPPLISKFYDMVRMRQKAFSLQRKYKFDMVHCRSYLAADVGLSLKKKFGTKLFFDMRGFWADEKKDGGAWNLKSPLYRSVYRYYKKKEAEYLQHADFIISLTEAGKKEMTSWPAYNSSVSVGVIPCCADMKHFSLTDPAQKVKSRELLKLPPDILVISYLGSIGSWYMLDEMLELFLAVKKEYKDAMFLFITHTDPKIIITAMTSHGIDAKDFMIVNASREQVPLYVKASDINISFIKPVYSKLSSSPTKMGEVLSMGIPVITNAGVGDVEYIMTTTRAGIAIKEFNEKSFTEVVRSIPGLLSLDPATIRDKAGLFYDLEMGILKYKKAYDEVFDHVNKREI